MTFRLPRLSAGSLVLLVSALAAGCSSVHQAYKAYENAVESNYVDDARAACTRYGFRPGTDAFAGCVSANVTAAKERDTIEEAAETARRSRRP